MGVKDLMRWVRTKHPSAVKELPQRWASPVVRGKRIAIDGTLLTNRFHFANFDGVLSEKSALIGWYTMIQDMRAQGCEMVAIWDERGVRPWKAPEARKRLAKRALDLARQAHEQRRLDRLAKLRSAIEQLSTLDHETRQAITEQWVETRFLVQPVNDTADAVPDVEPPPAAPSGQTGVVGASTGIVGASTGVVGVSAALGLLASPAALVAQLVSITEAYRRDNKPFVKTDQTADIEQVIVEKRVFDRNPNNGTDGPETAAEQSALDSRLVEAVPEERYTESPSQHRLTVQEGEIIHATLSGQTAHSLEDLNELADRAPEVKRIYDKALNAPTVAVHEDCKELLERMGVPVLEAAIPYEAEGLAAALATAGIVDFVGTEDSDVLAYNAPLLRNLSSTQNPLQLVDSSEVQRLAQMSPATFLDFCILLGTDASLRIPKVGMVKAEALIRKHGRIEELLHHETKIRETIERLGQGPWLELVGNARRVFGQLPPVPAGVRLDMGAIDLEAVNDWLDRVHGVSVVELDEDEEPRWQEKTLPTRAPITWNESDTT